MSWFDRGKTVELTNKLEKTPAGTCPVCGDTPLLALVAKENAGLKLSMLSLETGETVNHMGVVGTVIGAAWWMAQQYLSPLLQSAGAS